MRLTLESEIGSGAIPPDTGLAVGVVDGDTTWVGAYGLRERDRQLPVTPRTVFEVGSATKAFTAAALVVASEAGRIDLDAPLPPGTIALSDAAVAARVTIIDLLCHRTGLPANDLLWYLSAPAPAALARAVSQLPIPPGAYGTFTYNNMLYGMLGLAFERLVGMTWKDAVSRTFLGPLGMTSTSFGPCADEGDVALPYVGGRRVPRADLGALAAAGAMRSSAEDLTRWLAFLLRGGVSEGGSRVISGDGVRSLFRRRVSADTLSPLVLQGLEWLGPDVGYGLGWMLGATHGAPAAFHPGLIDGFSCALVVIPEQRRGVVALANLNGTALPGRTIQAVLDHLAGATRTEPAAMGPEPTVAGIYTNTAYGALALETSRWGWKLRYGQHAWPLVWKDECEAEFVVTAFGLAIPLTLRVDEQGALAIPFSLDPRVAPELFARAT